MRNHLSNKTKELGKTGFLYRHRVLAAGALGENIPRARRDLANLARVELGYSKTTAKIDILASLQKSWDVLTGSEK